MSINLNSGSLSQNGMSMSPNIFSGSILFADGQYVTVSPASTQFNLVGDFTIEAWVYPTYLNSGNWGIFDARVNGSSAAPWAVALQTTGSGYVIMFFDGVYNYGTNTVPLNVWSHIAVVRSGGVLTYYLNGAVDTVFSSYGTGAISPGSTNPVVGIKDQIAGGLGTVGNISNLRLVVGTAIYTSAFTPPAGPLTLIQSANFNGFPSAALASTASALLLNTPNNNYCYSDTSVNNFTLTQGSTVISSMNPFNNLGSIQFNGIDQKLSIASNSEFDFGTGDFTIEAWINPVTISPPFDSNFIYAPGAEGANALMFGFSGGGQLGWGQAGVSWEVRFDANGIVILNQWNHVVLTRSGTNMKIFVNGIQLGTTTTNSTNYGQNNGIILGGYPAATYYFNGCMSNIRVAKGVAVYTGNFTPPAVPLHNSQPASTNISAVTSSQTSLLLNSVYGSNYLVDSSTNNFTVTPIGTLSPASIINSPFSNISSGSILFNGSTDYLTVANSLPLGSSDFTIEAWVYPLTTSAGCIYIGQSDLSSASGSQVITYVNTVQTSDIYVGGGAYTVASPAPAVYTWSHVAYVRNGSAWSTYLNGVLVATASVYGAANAGNPANPPSIGGLATSNFFNGYISNFRLVIGTAVYTSDFNVPSTPLSISQSNLPIANTSVLLNTVNNIYSLKDSSINNFTITAHGTPTSSGANPFNTLTIPVDYLVVAGGGSGAGYAGGGGAGGLLTGTGYRVAPGSTYTVTVGAGGAAVTTVSDNGNDGSSSLFAGITSTGGGGGGGYGVAGRPGGSGGGGGLGPGNPAGGAATPSGQGNAGGIGGTYSNPYPSGGGGGAGAAGGNAVGSTQSGNGGVGLQLSISGTSTYYAGGGGGGIGYVASGIGTGGLGGGGNGGNAGTGVSGTANTGGGGGGQGYNGGAQTGGAGGSGIVIVRYADSYAAASATTGSPTITVSGGYRTYVWNSSGSITF